jgi:hypothetical protein
MIREVPVDDDYGMHRINAMIADAKAEYAAEVRDTGGEAVDGDISEGF